MKQAVNLTYQGENVKELFGRASWLYKVANFNKQSKFRLVIEAIKSDQVMLQFVSLREATTFEEFRNAFFEYTENQTVTGLTSGRTIEATELIQFGQPEKSNDKRREAIEQMDTV